MILMWSNEVIDFGYFFLHRFLLETMEWNEEREMNKWEK